MSPSATAPVCVYATAPTHLVVDIAGYLRTNGGSLTRSINPGRALDTRVPTPGRRLPAKTSTAVTVVDPARGVPSSATSVLLNVTTVSPLVGRVARRLPVRERRDRRAIANFIYTARRDSSSARSAAPACRRAPASCVSTQW